MTQVESPRRNGWQKRKSCNPVRTLSRLSNSEVGSGRSSPTLEEAVPGVLIRFVGETTVKENSDDSPQFSLRILRENSPGYSSLPASYPGSRSSTPTLEKQNQIYIKFPLSDDLSGATRKGRRSRSQKSSAVDYESDESEEEASEDGGDSEKDSSSPKQPSSASSSSNRKKKKGNSASADKAAAAKKCCSSCGTKKTPYWREGWESTIVLCNACGIRYQKYKKFCPHCIAIARKDEKGRLHCPECQQKL